MFGYWLLENSGIDDSDGDLSFESRSLPCAAFCALTGVDVQICCCCASGLSEFVNTGGGTKSLRTLQVQIGKKEKEDCLISQLIFITRVNHSINPFGLRQISFSTAK